MRFLTRLSILLLLTVPSLQAASNNSESQGKCSAEWRRVDEGLRYRKISCLADDAADFHLLEVDPDRIVLNVAVKRSSVAKDIAHDQQALFALNANFFDGAGKTLGVLIRSGEEIQRSRTSSWQSIFYVDREGKPGIALPGSWSRKRSKAFMAVQAGPRLVVDRHTARVHHSYPASRTGVCLPGNGKVIFFVTAPGRKFDIVETAQIARRAADDGGLGCRDAMLMDGGHSTQLYVEGKELDLSVKGDPVPAFIYGKRK